MRRNGFGKEQLRSLGRRLRQLREGRNWSLKRLSAESGVSVAAIQKIEVGDANPNLLTVLAITEVLGEPVDRLVESSRELGTKVNLVRGVLPGCPKDLVSLAAHLAERRMESYLLPVRPKKRLDIRDHGFDGAAFIYVLKGEVILDCPERPKETLGAGDALHCEENLSFGLSGCP